MRVGSKVGEEEEVGNAKSVREHGHGKRVIEMRWLNDGRLMLISGGTGQHPMLLSPSSEVIEGRLGTLHLLEHASFSRSCLPFGVGPALQYQSMAGGGRREAVGR